MDSFFSNLSVSIQGCWCFFGRLNPFSFSSCHIRWQTDISQMIAAQYKLSVLCLTQDAVSGNVKEWIVRASLYRDDVPASYSEVFETTEYQCLHAPFNSMPMCWCGYWVFIIICVVLVFSFVCRFSPTADCSVFVVFVFVTFHTFPS